MLIYLHFVKFVFLLFIIGNLSFSIFSHPITNQQISYVIFKNNTLEIRQDLIFAGPPSIILRNFLNNSKLDDPIEQMKSSFDLIDITDGLQFSSSTQSVYCDINPTNFKLTLKDNTADYPLSITYKKFFTFKKELKKQFKLVITCNLFDYPVLPLMNLITTGGLIVQIDEQNPHFKFSKGLKSLKNDKTEFYNIEFDKDNRVFTFEGLFIFDKKKI